MAHAFKYPALLNHVYVTKNVICLFSTLHPPTFNFFTLWLGKNISHSTNLPLGQFCLSHFPAASSPPLFLKAHKMEALLGMNGFFSPTLYKTEEWGYSCTGNIHISHSLSHSNQWFQEDIAVFWSLGLSFQFCGTVLGDTGWGFCLLLLCFM